MSRDDFSAPPPETADTVVAALRRLLRPLVRLLITCGVTYPALTRILKEIYVAVADREFGLEGKQQTDSRINLLTGVHRKDVRRLRQAGDTAAEPPAAVSLGAQLVGIWAGSPDYRDGEGRILPLSRHRGGDGPSFDDLVESVSKDLRPRAVLDEWLRLGVVRIGGDDKINLNTEAFVPSKGFKEKAYYFGRNVGDHVAAAAHNLLEEGPAKLERSVYYDRLTAESIAVLHEKARREGMRALKSVNEEGLRLAQADAGKAAARHRMNFGLYFYDAPEDPGDSQEDS